MGTIANLSGVPGERPVGETRLPGEGVGHFTWLGPGATGFVLPSSISKPRPPGGRGGIPVERVRSAGETDKFLEGTASRDQLAGLASFFARGGGSAHVVEVPTLAGKGSKHWLGEDGGPGARTGLFAFLDRDEVGAVVVPPLRAQQVAKFLDVARAHPHLFLFLEEAGRAGREGGDHRSRATPSARVVRPLPNVAIVRAPVPEGWGAGGLAGYLEAVDYRPTSVPAWGGAAVSRRSALRPLLAWRRWAALRRSLDHGSRWVVFEPHHSLVWRRLEREVRAFLHALVMDGLLPAWGGPGLEVRCEPATEGRVVLKVRVAMAGMQKGPQAAGGGE